MDGAHQKSPIPFTDETAWYCGLEDRHTLPEVPAIYWVRESADTILYIVATGNLRVRWRNHHRWAQFVQHLPGVGIFWLYSADDDIRHVVESELLQKFRPRYNTQFPFRSL